MNRCFPPSDVDLMRHPQKEWNRTRQALREHRKANAPAYLVRADRLTPEDKNKIVDHEDSEVIEIQGLMKDEDPNGLLTPLRHDPINPTLYDTGSLERDILMSVGTQQADIGPVGRTTATESSISEHSKMSTRSSNIDDLDDLLSGLAKSAGEMMLREFSGETVKRIAGDGAVWPEQNREDFINQIYLDTKAASSGRPNRALEVQNIQTLGPLLLQAGANPVGIVEEVVRRLDDQLEVERFLPLTPAPMAQGQQQQQSRPPRAGGQGRPQPKISPQRGA